MAVTIQLRRDTESALGSVVAAQGEMLLATDTHNAVIGDGATSFSALVTANRFFKFEDGDGGRTFGGNENNETITVRGGATQSNPIFKVTTNNTSNSIVEIYDDTQLVKIDATHGATGDKTLLLKAKASQTGSVIEVQDSSSTDARFKVLEDGQTTITPNDTTSPSLDVKGSGGSQSNGILRVQDTGGNAEFTVSDGGATVAGTLGVTGETTATGGIKVDDITEKTADHGVAIAKPITVTGNIIGNSNLVIPNQPCQTRITQTDATAEYNLRGDPDATSISFTKVTQLAVAITPAVASSKILIELSLQGGDEAAPSNADRPEGLIGTLFRKVGSGSDVDLSASNSSGFVNGLFFTTCTRFTTRGSVSTSLNMFGQHLDTPSYSLGDTLTYSLGLATFVDSASTSDGVDFRLNFQEGSFYHQAKAVSLIKVTEIPQ
jgi:hypothetical protein